MSEKVEKLNRRLCGPKKRVKADYYSPPKIRQRSKYTPHIGKKQMEKEADYEQ